MPVQLRVRQSPTSNWVTNFSAYGWKVRDHDNTIWISMTPDNTKVRSMDNTTWISVV